MMNLMSKTWSKSRSFKHLNLTLDYHPKELNALCGASNMNWIIRKALGEWVVTHIVFGDLRIALCWTTSENRRLGIFHRSRVLQIKRGTQIDKLVHVRSEHNPCDIGTSQTKLI
jgi:hypothetical protein